MLKRCFLIAVTVFSQVSCVANSQQNATTPNSDLMKFAYASCLLPYFQSKGIDTTDIRSISGGFVEKSEHSLDKFQEVALAVRNYNPQLNTKNDIDPNLNRCFFLEESEELREILSEGDN